MYTATRSTTASPSRTGSSRSTASSAHRHCIPSSCVVVWLSSALRSYVLSLSAVVSSTCGSAVLVPVSCSTWVFRQQQRVLSTRMYTSMCLKLLLHAAHNSSQDIRLYHCFLRGPITKQHPWPSILLQLDLFCWCRLDPSRLHYLSVLF